MSRELFIACRSERLGFSEEEVIRFFVWLDSIDELNVEPGELSLVFMSDDELAELHGRFLDDPTPTDVITFPGDSDDGMAGEICVSVDRAEVVSGSGEPTFAEELSLYLIHGWLHLAGYCDLEEEKRALMHARQDALLKEAAEASLIPSFSLRS